MKRKSSIMHQCRKAHRIEHCECLSLTYLLSHNSPITISYIGLSELLWLSELLCKVCFLRIQFVGKVTGCNFNIIGCHDKWYPGWSILALRNHRFKDNIDHLLLNIVELEMCDGFKASNFPKPWALSDSSSSTDLVGLCDYCTSKSTVFSTAARSQSCQIQSKQAAVFHIFGQPRSPTVSQIPRPGKRTSVYKHINRSAKPSIQWCPVHSKPPENEIAHQIAKKATT